jgi:tRNA(His) 5'-end guanylyltransferase
VESFLRSSININLWLEKSEAFDSRILVLQREEIPCYFHLRQLKPSEFFDILNYSAMLYKKEWTM